MKIEDIFVDERQHPDHVRLGAKEFLVLEEKGETLPNRFVGVDKLLKCLLVRACDLVCLSRRYNIGDKMKGSYQQ